ncbi:MAG TPA: cytochrome c3 family protein [Verrucomicrobiota bacterium]|nr:cytochrome c3 family protein [Verrucomicrobiota bacterium]
MGVAATVIVGFISLTSHAQPTALGQIGARALTPQEIKDYGLPSTTQTSGGLFNVGLGQPVYLEAQVRTTIAASNILGVTWELTQRPVLSTAALAASPLPTNMPIYNPGDRGFYRLADRQLLKPDVRGQYMVRATIQTNGGSFSFTREITGAEYLGVSGSCNLCHAGGTLPDMLTPWSKTHHAGALSNALDGVNTDHFSQNCIKCHSVGYDTTVGATNGGFDDIQAQTGWTFPPTLTNGNFMGMPASLRNKSNVQCENCHGAGSEHAFNLGNTNRITVSFSAGDCSQCHDSEPYHVKGVEWANSLHAVATRTPTGETRASCVRCHSAYGFVDFAAGKPQNQQRTQYEAITCAACHDPHGDANNPHLLRKIDSVTLMDNKTVITNGGFGQLCMNCHIARRDATNYVETTAGSGQFGPHYGPQTDMLVGANAITYGKVIPSSTHAEVVKNTCVACHLQEVAGNDPNLGIVGGHTFRPGWDGGTPNDTSDDVHLVNACVQCHGNITTFDFPRKDYDGDGVIEGVQTEVKGLLDRLGRLLPPIGSPTVSITAAYTKAQLRAAYNYRFVLDDGSYGIHNLSYAVGLLNESIGDLTDDRNSDSLPDTWQTQYFGSPNSPNAAPNASPAGDGVPNWLKYALNLDPWVAGVVLPDGVVWANAGDIAAGGEEVRIYTAAEVVFNTQVGKTYQIQSVGDLSGGWQNVGAPIAGNGNSVSYVTPTRSNAQQFYRVLITP